MELKRVLWIEDQAFEDAQDFSGPVNTSGEYRLEVAEDASAAVRALAKGPFAAVIVDIRIRPGNDQEWVDLFQRRGGNKVRARLGRHLLYSLLKPAAAEVKLKSVPKWIKPEGFGVLSVEGRGEVSGDLHQLKVSNMETKTAETPKTALLDMLNRITSD